MNEELEKMADSTPWITENGHHEAKQQRRMMYLMLIQEIHELSGLSLREVAQACDMDHTYVHYILNGKRQPKRDIIIALGFAYRLDLIEVDEILLLAGLPPLGRSALAEFRYASGLNGQSNNRISSEQISINLGDNFQDRTE